MHPTTHWPVPACHGPARARISSWNAGQLNATWTETCADCSGWLDAEPSEQSRNLSRTFALHSVDEERSYGAALRWQDDSMDRMAAAGTWLEVHRIRMREEGHHAYGFWLSPAPGSGIWMEARRPLQVPHKAVAAQLLVREWQSRNPSVKFDAAFERAIQAGEWNLLAKIKWTIIPIIAARSKARGDAGGGKLFWHSDSSMAYLAYELGYDTVQVRRNAKFIQELVCCAPECNMRVNCCQTCDLYTRALQCGFDPNKFGVCPGLRSLRAGLANQPCGCVEPQSATAINVTATLNCGGFR
jgi:hypothetical protein